MQVDPIKPTLKPPKTKRLKYECDLLLSTSGFTFSLRRCTKGVFRTVSDSNDMMDAMPRLKLKRQRQQDKSAADLLAAVADGGNSPR